MVLGAKAWTENNQKTSRVSCIIKLKWLDTLLSTTKVRCRKPQLFSGAGGSFVFSVTPFFLRGGGGA